MAENIKEDAAERSERANNSEQLRVQNK